MVVDGHFRPGEHIQEIPLAAELRVSRIPLRLALERLAHEGLLEIRPTRGFVVQHFSTSDIYDAIDLRGLLEGTAARLACERLRDSRDLAALRESSLAMEALFTKRKLTSEAFTGYITWNARFHKALAESVPQPDSPPRHRADLLPFPSALPARSCPSSSCQPVPAICSWSRWTIIALLWMPSRAGKECAPRPWRESMPGWRVAIWMPRINDRELLQAGARRKIDRALAPARGLARLLLDVSPPEVLRPRRCPLCLPRRPASQQRDRAVMRHRKLPDHALAHRHIQRREPDFIFALICAPCSTRYWTMVSAPRRRRAMQRRLAAAVGRVDVQRPGPPRSFSASRASASVPLVFLSR